MNNDGVRRASSGFARVCLTYSNICPAIGNVWSSHKVDWAAVLSKSVAPGCSLTVCNVQCTIVHNVQIYKVYRYIQCTDLQSVQFYTVYTCAQYKVVHSVKVYTV